MAGAGARRSAALLKFFGPHEHRLAVSVDDERHALLFVKPNGLRGRSLESKVNQRTFSEDLVYVLLA